MDDNLQEIGGRIKEARLGKKMTQVQLAEAAGISVSFLSNIELGTQSMNIRTLIAISNVLDVSTDWILKNDTSAAAAIVRDEIQEELDACSPKERETILKLVHTMRESLSSLRPPEDE